MSVFCAPRFVVTRYGVFALMSKVFFILFLQINTLHAQEGSKILMLGDSLTQGYGLSESDGLVPQLQRWLERESSFIQVINGGVSGDTTAGGLSRVDWLLTPDINAVVVALGGNDMLRGIDPSYVQQNLDQISQIIRNQERGLLIVGIPALLNYGPDYKKQFDDIFPMVAQKYDALYIDSFLTPLLEVENNMTLPRELMQADGIHPNAKGVAMIVEYIGPRILQLAADE